MQSASILLQTLRKPILILLFILLYLAVRYLNAPEEVSNLILFLGIGLGSIDLVIESVKMLLQKRFMLDYIAILSIITGIITQEYLVAIVIVLMLSGGNALENYAERKARGQLASLVKRIPEKVILLSGDTHQLVDLKEIIKNNIILIRKGEVVPVDGLLEDTNGALDESAVTGESDAITKAKGDIILSGTLNVGNPIKVRVTKSFADSTYSQILKLVEEAQTRKSNFIRLTEKYNLAFTLFALVIAVIAYVISGNSLDRVLAVLVVATPCPLILATPVALIGGVNSAARKNIIFKQITALEKLSMIDTIAFDKTGTLTLDTPKLQRIENRTTLNDSEILAIAAAIERNSLHPIAKSIVLTAKEKQLKYDLPIDLVEEEVAMGIKAKVGGNIYTIKKSLEGSAVDLCQEENIIAKFYFEELPKEGTRNTLRKLIANKLSVYILTGDKNEKAVAMIAAIGLDIEVMAELSPVSKKAKILELGAGNKKVAMVGDGINDAPSLASAYVGMAFVHDEKSAASEAADIIFLSSNIDSVYSAIYISKKTISIAKQSIFTGITLSTIFMTIAAGGFITPIVGAVIQELIDVAVILNSLRASYIKTDSDLD